jgi:Zn-dependent alcohol dehydrogenase
MKTRAAVLRQVGLPHPYKDSRPLVIEELTLAPPGRDEVLVRVRAVGLCHSDLSVINGDRPRPVPMALGHEAAGEVMQLGDGVVDLAIGDHVALVFVPSCGHCTPCAEGRPALCEPGAAANGAGTLLSAQRRLADAIDSPSTSALLGIRRACRRVAALAGEDRPCPGLRRSGPLRLRRAHGRRRGDQHRASARRAVVAVIGLDGVRAWPP